MTTDGRAGGPLTSRPSVVEASRWTGWPRAAERAAARGHARAGTDHLLLALLDGPPGPACQTMTSAGVVPANVYRALEAIIGPNATLLEAADPARVGPGDRAHAVLMRAAVLAERSRSEDDRLHVVDEPPPPDDVHVLLALATHNEPCLALLVLQQLEAVPALRRSLGPYI